ncbi:MAG: type II toxin-antitoxin system RelE/ParE family toxin [Synergistaceae bacterium]|nr:type II toxin-antitoxin system RelE/ParE family toxin [Synergistaceae bacterium]MBQ6737449.1 type II toxin-antitoxin system RelE/ParE family toxin [Synergistaceae bacterium]MBR0079930.1 type II toxin-antitoxin system RelE/ParE family toxin [Synergistaceae bacterium]MBR0233471.1 type II toxin-antitoxin system RelE/ParE family toxin [Synergistaceae bacterium]
MHWKIEYSIEAQNKILKLDKTIRKRIENFVERLSELPSPRMRGEALTGNLSEFWKYRVGDYRLICRIQDDKLIVLVVTVGHRSRIYKNFTKF